MPFSPSSYGRAVSINPFPLFDLGKSKDEKITFPPIPINVATSFFANFSGRDVFDRWMFASAENGRGPFRSNGFSMDRPIRGITLPSHTLFSPADQRFITNHFFFIRRGRGALKSSLFRDNPLHFCIKKHSLSGVSTEKNHPQGRSLLSLFQSFCIPLKFQVSAVGTTRHNSCVQQEMTLLYS